MPWVEQKPASVHHRLCRGSGQLGTCRLLSSSAGGMGAGTGGRIPTAAGSTATGPCLRLLSSPRVSTPMATACPEEAMSSSTTRNSRSGRKSEAPPPHRHAGLINRRGWTGRRPARHRSGNRVTTERREGCGMQCSTSSRVEAGRQRTECSEREEEEAACPVTQRGVGVRAAAMAGACLLSLRSRPAVMVVKLGQTPS